MTSKLPTYADSTTPLLTGAMPPVVISLFGAFSVQINGQFIDSFRSSKARGLLAYLLLTHAQPLLRTTLVDLLWPDYDASSGKVNLRQVLSNIRDSLAPFDLLHADRHHVTLAVDPTTIWCDALHLDMLLDGCRRHVHRSIAHCAACQERLRQALALYKGPLLDTLPTVDSTPFMAWVEQQRAYFADRFAEVQAALATVVALPGNLTPPLTPLIGRTNEIADLAHKLEHPVYRCVSLVGPGGIGKTRLARALGEQVKAHYPYGVWLIELGVLAPAAGQETEDLQDRLATAIGVALGLAFQGAARPTAQVATYLADKSALLLLDSFEHLSESAAWLPALLATAPHLRLLVTSRHHLPLQSQLVYHVEGLALPPPQATALSLTHLIAQYASLQLFVERAESAEATLTLDTPTIATISQLCHFVGGSPWAIELAVSLLNQQSPAAILTAIQSNYRALATNLLDVPARQRSAEAVFLTTWQLLTPAEAQTLARCAVFQGGFTAEAAQTIAQATPATLQALVHKSLLQRTVAGRYAMHDLVRQFAAEQLAHFAATERTVTARHAAYYIQQLQGQERGLLQSHDAQKSVQSDLDNIRVAWRWSATQGSLTLLAQGVDALHSFYQVTGLHHEALQLLEVAVTAVRQAAAALSTDVGRTPLRLQARLACYMAEFYRHTGGMAAGERLAQETLLLGQQLIDPELQALAYHELMRLAQFRSDFSNIRTLAEQGCAQARQAGAPALIAECLNDLGVALLTLKHPLEAVPHLLEAVSVLETVDDHYLEARVLANLGYAYLYAHEYELALGYLQRTLALARLLQAPINILSTTTFLGDLWLALGLYGAAQAEYEEALSICQTVHNPYWESWLRASYGRLQYLRGDLVAACTTCTSAYQVAQQGRALLQQLWSLLYLGYAHMDLEKWEAAHGYYQQAIALQQQIQRRYRTADVHAGLALLALRQGKSADALSAAETALTLLTERGVAAAIEPFHVYWSCIHVLQANADPRANGVLRTAYQLLQGCAAQLTDATVRHAFLHTVASNRNLIAAAHTAGLT